MKINNSLNDLFRQAYAEAEGGVPSQSEVERLLRNSSVRSVPVTTGQRLYRSLFSTPLKIGMTAMTSVAIIALGIFAFWPQSSNQSIPVTSAPLQNTFQYAETPSSVAKSANKPAIARLIGNRSRLVERIRVPEPLLATADSLHPVDATPEQLAKLGIVLEDNGDIDFYTKEGNEVNKFGLPPTWGERIYMGEKISEKDTAGITMLKCSPRLVTEPDGARRLFSFQSDTTIALKDGNHTMLMRVQNQTRIAPAQSSLSSSMARKVLIQMLAGSGNERNVQVQADSDAHPTSSRVLVNTNVRVAVGDSIVGSSISQRSAKASSSTNVDSILKAINVDSIVRLASAELHGQNLDSTLKEVQTASKKIKKILSSMHIHVDTSTNASSNPSVDVEINTDDDNEIDTGDDNSPGLPPTPPIPPLREVEQAANSLDLSHLVPIRVVNRKNPNHPNVLIFWYDPTPEVEAILPKETTVQSVAAIKHVNVSIYPNPTHGTAMLHFELAGANSAQYTVRNLLGQEVMPGGALSGSTGDVPLDLSKLEAGVYLLVTTTNTGVPDVERVVVTK